MNQDTKEYLRRLAEIEVWIATEYFYGPSVAGLIVGKAEMDKHSSGIEEVEDEARELAYFVENCIKEYLKEK